MLWSLAYYFSQFDVLAYLDEEGMGICSLLQHMIQNGALQGEWITRSIWETGTSWITTIILDRLNTESSKAQSKNKRPEQTFRAVICSNVVELIYLFNSLKGAQGQHPPQNSSTTFYCNIQYPPLLIPREAFLKLWSVTLTLKLLYAAVLKRQTDQPTTDRIFL